MGEQNHGRVQPVEFGRRSFWRDSSEINDEQAQEHAARLEQRASAASERAVRDEYVGLLGISSGARVLDVGCGSGAVTRTLAQRVAPSGLAVGCDASGAMIKVARRLADEAGLGATIQFVSAVIR